MSAEECVAVGIEFQGHYVGRGLDGRPSPRVERRQNDGFVRPALLSQGDFDRDHGARRPRRAQVIGLEWQGNSGGEAGQVHPDREVELAD